MKILFSILIILISGVAVYMLMIAYDMYKFLDKLCGKLGEAIDAENKIRDCMAKKGYRVAE